MNKDFIILAEPYDPPVYFTFNPIIVMWIVELNK